MEKSVFIHIGMGKTGTTAIQRFLLQNKELIRSRGFLYPEEGLFYEGHHLLSLVWSNHKWANHVFDECRVKKNADEVWLKIKKLCNQQEESMLISSEGFLEVFLYNKDSAPYVIKMLGKNIRIIVYFRRQDSCFESAYRTSVLNNFTTDPPEPYSEIKSTIYNWYSNLEILSKYFGKDNIIVRPYEKQQLLRGDVRVDFVVNALGIPWSDDFILEKSAANASYNDDVLDFFRLVNKTTLSVDQKSSLKKALLPYFDHTISDQYFQNHAVLTPSQRIMFKDYFAESNAKVAREYLGREDGQMFYDAWPDPNDSLDKGWGVSVERMIEVLSKYWDNKCPEHNDD